jgi:type IV pilus assembly protein PilC
LLILLARSSWWWGSAYGLVDRRAGWIADRLPWIGTTRLHQALAEVLDFTAEAVESGRPIGHSLAEAFEISDNSFLRRKMNRWALELSRGQSLADSARISGMPALVCGMIATGMQTSDLAPVFRFLGRYYATRFSRTITMLEAAILPLLAIGMGSLVGWMALSVFLPIIKMSDHVVVFAKGL